MAAKAGERVTADELCHDPVQPVAPPRHLRWTRFSLFQFTGPAVIPGEGLADLQVDPLLLEFVAPCSTQRCQQMGSRKLL
jgi:hypothetical protein